MEDNHWRLLVRDFLQTGFPSCRPTNSVGAQKRFAFDMPHCCFDVLGTSSSLCNVFVCRLVTMRVQLIWARSTVRRQLALSCWLLVRLCVLSVTLFWCLNEFLNNSNNHTCLTLNIAGQDSPRKLVPRC